MAFRVVVIGTATVRRDMREMRRRCADLWPAFDAIGLYMVNRTVHERFEKERDPEGQRWAPWSKGYREYMNSIGRGGNRILTNTHELVRSINHERIPNGVRFGTNKEYARQHQEGARKGEYGEEVVLLPMPDGTKIEMKRPKPRGRIPARPFLGITEAELQHCMDIMRQHVDGTAR